MLHAQASVSIPTPAKYMARLCNHFAHRVTVQREETSARVNFPNAPCSMQALDDCLEIRIESTDAATLQLLQGVVARHLKQVAASETLKSVGTSPRDIQFSRNKFYGAAGRRTRRHACCLSPHGKATTVFDDDWSRRARRRLT